MTAPTATQLSLFEHFHDDFPESTELAVNISAKKGLLFGLTVEHINRFARNLRAGREFDAIVRFSTARVAHEYHDAKKDNEESGIIPTVYLRIEDIEIPA